MVFDELKLYNLCLISKKISYKQHNGDYHLHKGEDIGISKIYLNKSYNDVIQIYFIN